MDENKDLETEETEKAEPEVVVPPKRDYEEELLGIIQSDLSPEEIREKLADYHDNDIASVFGLLTEADRRKLYRVLSDDEISDIFSYLDNVEDYIAELDAEKAADIIENMDADDAVDVLDELEDDTRREIIDLMDDEAVEDIQMITSYDDDMVGSRMTTNFIVVSKSFSVKQAMKSVIDQAAENDNISTIYVVDENEAFCGAIDLRDLVIARSTQALDDIITVSYPYVYATESVEGCIEELKEYSEDSIPVLDNDNKIIGVITSSDIVEVVDEELGEDYAKLAGLSEEEDLEEPVFKSVKKRLPWLMVLLFLALGVSTVVGVFDRVIDTLAYLVFFQSMILDMAGNVGTQSLAVTIRVISGGDIDRKTAWKLLFKEIRVGLMNGLIVGALAFVASAIYLTVAGSTSTPWLAATCISVAMIAAMVMSSFTGTVIPMLFKKMKIDPAVASGPLITTVNDMVAVCVYYSLAIILLMSFL
ncbi:MAG: magnesium transporter [Clostridia bacterium]|nr:magnesium transporter [Clostridia bacterium]